MYLPELEEETDKVLNNTSDIIGDAVKNLEEFTKAKHAITCRCITPCYDGIRYKAS